MSDKRSSTEVSRLEATSDQVRAKARLSCERTTDTSTASTKDRIVGMRRSASGDVGSPSQALLRHASIASIMSAMRDKRREGVIEGFEKMDMDVTREIANRVRLSAPKR